jgi:hypothetical protein
MSDQLHFQFYSEFDVFQYLAVFPGAIRFSDRMDEFKMERILLNRDLI